jgi:hypothetical protein
MVGLTSEFLELIFDPKFSIFVDYRLATRVTPPELY